MQTRSFNLHTIRQVQKMCETWIIFWIKQAILVIMVAYFNQIMYIEHV